MKTTLLTMIALTAPVLAWAHEGHDHNAPSQTQAPKGGVMKSLERTHVEVVSKGKDVKIYLYDKELKPQDAATYKVSATAELPRTKKAEAVPLTAKANFFEGSFDAKGAHRYTLKLAITDPKTKHDDRMEFTIEPRKK
jgi:hypothetical protein